MLSGARLKYQSKTRSLSCLTVTLRVPRFALVVVGRSFNSFFPGTRGFVIATRICLLSPHKDCVSNPLLIKSTIYKNVEVCEYNCHLPIAKKTAAKGMPCEWNLANQRDLTR